MPNEGEDEKIKALTIPDFIRWLENASVSDVETRLEEADYTEQEFIDDLLKNNSDVINIMLQKSALEAAEAIAKNLENTQARKQATEDSPSPRPITHQFGSIKPLTDKTANTPAKRSPKPQ